MSTMSSQKRKLTDFQDIKIEKKILNQRIYEEKQKPDYKKADKDTKRGRVTEIFKRFQRKVG